MVVEKYLVSGESVKAEVPKLSVNDEDGFTGFITNRRVIFLKKGVFDEFKMHDMEFAHLAGVSVVSKRRDYLLFGGLFSMGIGFGFVLPCLLNYVNPLILCIGVILLCIGVILLVLWYYYPVEYAKLRGGGHEIKVGTSEKKLEDFVTEVKNQLSLGKF